MLTERFGTTNERRECDRILRHPFPVPILPLRVNNLKLQSQRTEQIPANP